MDFKSVVTSIMTKVGNAGKVMTSKRVYATAGAMYMMSIVKEPVAMVCTTLIAITYIVCESLKKS